VRLIATKALCEGSGAGPAERLPDAMARRYAGARLALSNRCHFQYTCLSGLTNSFLEGKT